MRTETPTQGVSITPLFEVELLYKPEASEILISQEKDGTRLGGGDGTMRGSRLDGTVRWDIYEKGGAVTGESTCATQIVGFIETGDGARIEWDSRGYGIVPDAAQPNLWSMAAAVRFQSRDARYAWLNGVLAVWTGGFDMKTGRHRYQAFAQQERPEKG
jgi:hypothetical protein